MNDKQRAFCYEYIKDYNGTQSAIRAGYSEKTAGVQAEQLLKKLEISSLVNELTKQVQSEAIISVTERKELLSNIVRNAEFSMAIRAIDVLNKMDGVYNHPIGVRDTETIQFNIVLE